MNTLNADADEIAKFSAMAGQWWDSKGPLRTLHEINPIRLDYINTHTPLAGLSVLDLGCGGGLLSEGMAKKNARVSAIDLDEKAIEVAKAHALDSGLEIDYRCLSLESLVETQAQSFDLITCLEMLEHVPDPAAIIQNCRHLLKPGGFLYLSTLNRSLKSYGLAVLTAEYLLGLLPVGTHEFERFIKPSELAAWCRQADLELIESKGIDYQPFKHSAQLSDDLSVNYIAFFQKEL